MHFKEDQEAVSSVLKLGSGFSSLWHLSESLEG